MNPEASPPPARAHRSRAVRLGAQIGVGARVVSVLCTLAQVPIALGYLGAEGFGVWMTLTSIAGILTVGDFGISLGAKTVLAEAGGRNDLAAVRGLAWSALKQLCSIGAVLALVGATLAWAVDWAAVFHVSSPVLRQELPWAMTGVAVLGGLAIPTGLGPALAGALQKTWIAHASVAFGGIATLLLVALAAAGGWSWLALVLCSLALPIASNLAIGLAVARRHLPRSDAPHPIAPEETRRLAELGRWFFVSQVGALFMASAVPVFIASAAGPIATTAFNLLQRIFSLVGQTQWMALSAFWPAYSDARSRGDHEWITRGYRSSWRITVVAFLPALVILAVLTPRLVNWWVGETSATISPLLLASTAFWFAVQLCGQPPALLLNGFGRIRRVALFAIAGHVLSLAGMMIGGRMVGAPGVVLGMAAGYIGVGLPIVLLEARRALGELRP